MSTTMSRGNIEADPGRWAAHEDLLQYREEFPIFEQKSYLNSCSLGALSKRSMAGLNEYMALWGSMGASAWYELWLGRLAELRASIARVINASPNEIAIGPSISAATAVLASAFDYKKRNKVVLADLDFPTLGYQWLAKKKLGVEVEFARSTDRVSVDLEAFDKAIDERTLLVATSHVYFTSGYVQDIKALAEIAHRKGALLLVDAYQGTGQVPTDVQDAGVDFLMSGGLKWLLGGTGIVFTYVRGGLIPQLEPTTPGWFGMAKQFDFNILDLAYRDDAQRLETGTPSIPSVYTFLGGLSYIEEIGSQRIRERTMHLTEDLIARAIEAGFDPRVAVDPEKRSAIVLLNHDDPAPVVAALAAQGIIVDRRPGAVRVSPYFYNQVEENARIIETMVRLRG